MIHLYQGPRAWGLPNVSQFSVKVETYLRLAEIPYEAISTDPRRAPKGKLPWIEHDGRAIGDSGLILEHLKARFGDPLDAHLTAAERARGHLVRRMLEESTYFVSLYARWMEDENFAQVSRVLFAALPAPVRLIAPPLVRKRVKSALLAQGYGRHRPEEVYALGLRDLEALAEVLADAPFLLGERPTSYDCTVYAALAGLIVPPLPSPLQAAARAEPRFGAYVERMQSRAWAGWRPEQG